jgi:hypothetical protein
VWTSCGGLFRSFLPGLLGERDFHAFEAVQLGMSLPLVIPLMPIISLNTGGARPLKSRAALKEAGPEAPVHYDSRVDRFDQRLKLVRKQSKDVPGDAGEHFEWEVRDVSFFEFWWKYFVNREENSSVREVCVYHGNSVFHCRLCECGACES